MLGDQIILYFKQVSSIPLRVEDPRHLEIETEERGLSMLDIDGLPQVGSQSVTDLSLTYIEQQRSAALSDAIDARVSRSELNQ